MTLLEHVPHGLGRWLGDEPARRSPLSTWWDGVATSVGAFTPAVDVEETEDGFTLYVELPGIDPADLEVTLEGDVLTIAGERRFYDEQEEASLRRVERHFGRFHRSIRLPAASDPDGVAAHHREGILTIEVPKRSDARARRVAVTDGS